MLNIQTLINMLRLLYIEAYLKDSLGNSAKTITSLLSEHKPKDEITDLKMEGLVAVLKEMLQHDFVRPMTEQTYKYGLEMNIGKDEDIFKIIFSIPEEIEDLKAEAFNLRRSLTRQDKLTKLRTGFTRAYAELNGDEEIPDFGAFIQKTVEHLEDNNPDKTSDSAIIDSVDLGDSSALEAMMERVNEASRDRGVWKTQWQKFNDMTQGGLRSGQINFFNALQHNYKSGLTLTTFLSLPLLNPPKPSERKGKPTLVWVSFEDPLVKIFGDAFSYLKVWENPDCNRVNLDEYSAKEMSDYIQNFYKDTGYDVKFFRIDPSDFSFRALFDFLTDLEIKGASLRVVGLDYISHIPRVGCSDKGAMGADVRELVRRIKNWMEARDILCMSPHQLSSGAKALKREGLPDHELVAKVVNNGYTADSSQIDQELDLEVAMNIVKINGKSYLNVGRGKHKLNSVIDDPEKLNFYLPFPDNGNKIPPDVYPDKAVDCIGFHDIKNIPSEDEISFT